MGNRAVITDTDKRVGVYLHWNGGKHSVEAFLKYCKLRGFRDGSYGWARLCQVIGNFFGGTLSIGIDAIDHLDCDNGDNGMYIVDGWELVGHMYDPPCNDCYDVDEMVREIDECQPASERLGRYLDAYEVPVSEVKVGDVVWMDGCEGERVPYEVVGFGDGRWVNGRRVDGVPYTSMYGERSKDNPNAYIEGETCMVCPADDAADLIEASNEYRRRKEEWLHGPLACARPSFNDVLREVNERGRR